MSPALDRARRLAAGPQRRLLGLAGPPGAGKTTLAREVVTAVGAGAVHVPLDGFHLADVELDRIGKRGRKGAPETFDVAGYVAMLRRLREPADDVVYAPAFDREVEQAVAGSIPIDPACRLVVTEGNYLLLRQPGWRDVRALLDEVRWVDLDDELRRDRLRRRHEDFGKSAEGARTWVRDVDEPNARLVAAGRDLADVVVRGSGPLARG